MGDVLINLISNDSEGLIIKIKAFMTNNEQKVQYEDLTQLLVEKNEDGKSGDKSLVTIHFVQGYVARKIIVDMAHVTQVKKWAEERNLRMSGFSKDK